MKKEEIDKAHIIYEKINNNIKSLHWQILQSFTREDACYIAKASNGVRLNSSFNGKFVAESWNDLVLLFNSAFQENNNLNVLRIIYDIIGAKPNMTVKEVIVLMANNELKKRPHTIVLFNEDLPDHLKDKGIIKNFSGK